MTKPEVVEEDADSVTFKIPVGMKFELLKVRRDDLPKLYEKFQMALMQKGRVN